MPASTENLEGSSALPIFSYSTNGGSTWTPVAELIGEPSMGEPTTDSHELTNTDITDGRRTFTYGWVDEGEMAMEFNWREDSLAALRALLRQDLDWKISWTDPAHTLTDSEFTVGGFISKGPKPIQPMKGEWKITMSIKNSGIVTHTLGT